MSNDQGGNGIQCCEANRNAAAKAMSVTKGSKKRHVRSD